MINCKRLAHPYDRWQKASLALQSFAKGQPIQFRLNPQFFFWISTSIFCMHVPLCKTRRHDDHEAQFCPKKCAYRRLGSKSNFFLVQPYPDDHLQKASPFNNRQMDRRTHIFRKIVPSHFQKNITSQVSLVFVQTCNRLKVLQRRGQGPRGWPLPSLAQSKSRHTGFKCIFHHSTLSTCPRIADCY